MWFVCTLGATKPPTNSNFEAFGGGGGGTAQATWAQRPLRGSPWVLKFPYHHQMITHTDPRGQKRVSEKVETWQMSRCH